jgi:RNA polymerase-binding transcription factor DksA
VTASLRTFGYGAQETIKAHLPALRAALEEQRRFRQEQLRELSQNGDHRSARRSGDPRDEVTHALSVAATAALARIEEAIVRMENGTYGACRTCGADIPVERLEILPMAALHRWRVEITRRAVYARTKHAWTSGARRSRRRRSCGSGTATSRIGSTSSPAATGLNSRTRTALRLCSTCAS